MSNCHECGEEIAEVDTFCPYCGISLKPIMQESEENEVEEEAASGSLSSDNTSASNQREETIVINSEDILEVDFPPENLEQVQEQKDETKPSTVENQNVNLETDSSTSDEFSSIESAIDSVDKQDEQIPEEKLLFTARSLNIESTKEEFSSEPEVEVKPESSLDKETEDRAAFLDEFDQKKSQTDSPPLAEVTDAEFEKKSESDESEEIDFDQTLPYIPRKQVEEDEIFSASEDSIDTKEEPMPEISETPQIPHLLQNESDELGKTSDSKMSEESSSGEIPQIKDQPIAPPPVELTEPEEDSRFDSVQILENADQPETGVSSESLPEVSEVESEVQNTSDAESPGEQKSYTTPNIGLTDTDGKKSKLQPLEEGTILNDRYEIIRKIGGGGMGAVYLASDKNLGGVLRAVKEMVQSYIEEEQQDKAINDFKRESLLLTSLEHQSIPTIYDYFFDAKEARFYLVMRYINGGDLSSRLRAAPDGKIDEETVTNWGIQVADVLNYLHNRQPPIVYRDLKPANIMIDGNTGRVMLIDFGIARWINKEEKGVTAVGTMGYAPPELFSGNVEPSSDIYSLGSTMFHLLTGADPQNNPLLIFDFQKNPKPRQINPQISDQMERILMRMVEYNAEKRYSTAVELKKALEDHLEKLKAGKVSFGVKKAPAAVSLKDEKVFCGFCGQKIVASDLFCAFCGAKQPIATKGVHAENYASAPLTAKLVIMGTNELEPPSYKIEKDDNLVGRRDPMSNIFPEVDLSKFDPQTKISRRHARIWREGNNYLVEDLGSSNGTVLIPVVNETKRLSPKQPHILANGDKLKLGDTTLHFVIG